jgi:outer membrane protein assembly factor BamB
MCVTLIACAASSAVKSPKSPLSAVPPAPGMLLVRATSPGDSTAGQDHAVGVIVAVNLQNGQVLWRHALDLPAPQAVEEGKPLQPRLEGGLVLVPENYANQQGDHAFGELVALDPASGQERWTYTIAPATADLVTELDSEPVAANGVVYLTANERSTSAPLPPPQDQSLPTLLVQAVDSHTGSLLWSRRLSGFDSSPDVADGNVMLLGNNGLVALRTTDGSLAWTFTPAGPYTAVDDGGPPNEDYAVGEGYPGPVIVNHLVLVDALAVGADGQGLGATWFAVRTSTGKLVWQSARSVLGGGYTRPVLNERRRALYERIQRRSVQLRARPRRLHRRHAVESLHYFGAVDVRRVRHDLRSLRAERAGDLRGGSWPSTAARASSCGRRRQHGRGALQALPRLHRGMGSPRCLRKDQPLLGIISS